MALRRPKPVIELTKHGFVVRLDPDELGLIRHLLAELRGLVQSDDPATEPIRRRLFPPAYHLVEHSEQEAEYQRLMRDDLVASRLAALDHLDEVLAPTDGIVLDEAHRNGARLPVTALIDQFYAQVIARGGRRWDTSSLIHLLAND